MLKLNVILERKLLLNPTLISAMQKHVKIMFFLLTGGSSTPSREGLRRLELQDARIVPTSQQRFDS